MFRVSPRRDSASAEAAFRARLAELGATLLEPEWLGTTSPHRVLCAAGHECTPSPGNVQQGHGICRKCANRVRGQRQSLAAWAAFRARLAELGATLLEPEWLGSAAPHRALCAAGHECSPSPSKVQQGCGICRTCAGNDPRVAEARFRARVTELGAIMLETEWLGTNTPHQVRCADGHESKPRPSEVARGGGICRACSGKDPRVAEARFRARLAELGATLLEPKWLGVNSPHRVRCAAGHESSPHPGSVQQGQGICRTCAGNDPQAAEAAFRARLAELGATMLEPVWLGAATPIGCGARPDTSPVRDPAACSKGKGSAGPAPGTTPRRRRRRSVLCWLSWAPPSLNPTKAAIVRTGCGARPGTSATRHLARCSKAEGSAEPAPGTTLAWQKPTSVLCWLRWAPPSLSPTRTAIIRTGCGARPDTNARQLLAV